MIKSKLHEIAEEKNIPFENILTGYVKEEILSYLYKNGFHSCFCLKNPNGISFEGYKGRALRQLKFIYREDERILKSDGFVPGCPFSEDFMEVFYEEILLKLPNFTIQNKEVKDTTIYFDIYCENMYVPFFIEIEKEKEGFTPNQQKIFLPVLEETYEVVTYPVEQEAALHLGEILKDLELLNEMEHYLSLYSIFSRETLEGVRFQNALAEVLKKKHISISSGVFDMVLGYKNYSYMKKKWKVLLRRQKIKEPSWEEVIELLEAAVTPIWNTTKEDLIFFGDWMPEIGRYLD
ncbi:MAG: hypothetical protein K5675_08825 [Lachnospiraceae bacterium]|nr:hypothetical protein [Lachnospiraceae bacterium]